MDIQEIKNELQHRIHMMESERNKLRELEIEINDNDERYSSAIESLQEAIDRLSEVV